MLLDENNKLILRLATDEHFAASLKSYPNTPAYFGYADNYRDLIMKRMLLPSSLSIVYAPPMEIVAERFNVLIINTVQLNLLLILVLFSLA